MVYFTTKREGYREYKSREYLCKTYPTRRMCTENAKCEKTVLRHVWQDHAEMAEHVRYIPVYKELYRLRKEKIERVFADAKEKHGMRYTQYRGLAQVTNWVKLMYCSSSDLKNVFKKKLLEEVMECIEEAVPQEKSRSSSRKHSSEERTRD